MGKKTRYIGRENPWSVGVTVFVGGAMITVGFGSGRSVAQAGFEYSVVESSETWKLNLPLIG
jgi:hypothetical protein